MMRSIGAFLLFAFTTVGASATTLVMNARVEPVATLPGLPVLVNIGVSNSGESDARLPRLFVVEVTRDDGERFLVRYSRTDSFYFTLPEHYGSEIVVAKGTTARFQIGLGSGVTQGAFASDERTWKPGSYSLRFLFHDGFANGPADVDNLEATYPSAIRSDAVTLLIEEPLDEEERVWDAILQRTNGRVFEGVSLRNGPKIAGELFMNMAPNRYWSYVGMMTIPVDNIPRAEFLEKLLAQIPGNHPEADRLKLALAEAHLEHAIRTIEQAGDHAADDQLRDAYESLAAIAESSPNDAVRTSASEALGRVRHRPAIEKLNADVRDEK